MSRALIACIALTFFTLSAHSAEPQPPAIPIVKTLDDLRKLDPVQLPDGSKLRIGITESAAEGSPWRLVYCLPVDPNAPAVNPDGDPEEWLGPVTVRLIDARRSMEVTGSISTAEQIPLTGEKFYCTAIPTSTKGNFQIEIVAKRENPKQDPPVLFRTAMQVKESPACYWHRFVIGNATDEANAVIAPKPLAARPRYSGMSEDAWPTDAKADLPLDGLDRDHPLALSLDLTVADPKLSIASGQDMIDSPKDHLLARWWVNDRPVIAGPAEQDLKALQQNGWKISFSKKMQVTFSLPQTLGTLKAGDRVALQLMYCPAGIKPCFNETLKQAHPQMFVPRIVAHPATLPRLSEKLEITVTPEMLKPS